MNPTGLGPRRSWEQGRERRTYRCRDCGTSEDDYFMPDGWLQVRVRDPQADPGEHTYRIAGMYCTATCLAAEAAGWARAADPMADTGPGTGGR
jgi:hypothetical protein